MPKGSRKKSPVSKMPPDVFLHLAFDNSVQSNIITIVATGNIILANRAACKFFGYTMMQMLSRRVDEVFHTDRSFKKMISERMTQGNSTAIVHAVKKGGQLIPCETTTAIFSDERGLEKAIYAIVDISISQNAAGCRSPDKKNKK